MRALQDYPYIDARVEGSFARFTIKNRLPKIIQSIIQSHDWDTDIISNLVQFSSSIMEQRIERIESLSWGSAYWEPFWKRYDSMSILEAPFFFTEIYFYEKILDIIRFDTLRIDPFAVKKNLEVAEHLNAFKDIWSNLETLTLEESVHFSLTGNSADLSQINKSDGSVSILHDDSDLLISSLNEVDNVHLLLDNCGLELFSDLVLTMMILETYPELSVKMYPKARPIFVSDTTPTDIDFLVSQVGGAFQNRFNSLKESGRIDITVDTVWNCPIHFTDLTDNPCLRFEKNNLLISKGDANYRRFYEDRKIPLDFNGAATLTNNQFVIRTLKSEILAQFDPHRAKEISNKEPQWLSNGKFGIIQKLK